jgi:hypothetical protein
MTFMAYDGIAARKLRNDTKLNFIDISSEEFREYNFGSNGTIRINFPQFLSAGPNGHRILDNDEVSHYIPKGWISLSWKAREDAPHFVA